MFSYLFSFDSGILTYVSFLITNIAIYAMLGLGLNLQWGFTGLINFGVAGFVAVGAYGTVVLSMRGVPLPIAMMVGGLLAAIFGLGLGIATLRLREDYLAIVTIGAAELVRLVINNESLVDGRPGAIGINGFPLPLANFRPDIFTRYGMVLLLTGVFGLALWKLGDWGRRRLGSVRESKNKVWLTAVTGVGALVLVRADVVVTMAMLNFRDNQVVNGLLFCSVLMAALVFLLVET